MGMFDEVVCKFLLPEGFQHIQDKTFQTKDFPDPLLEKYEIKADGTIHDYYGDTEYHGDLHFYTLLDGWDEGESHQLWYDFYARFTDGMLVKLEGERKVTEHENDPRKRPVLPERQGAEGER